MTADATAGAFALLPLDGRDRSGFASGVEPLDRYFRTQVSQDVRRRVAACTVAVEQATQAIAGFYTLSAADVPVADVAPELTRRLPRYPTLPAARLGRLAVDARFRGRQLGTALLADAVRRAAGSEGRGLCHDRGRQGRGGRGVLPTPRLLGLRLRPGPDAGADREPVAAEVRGWPRLRGDGARERRCSAIINPPP